MFHQFSKKLAIWARLKYPATAIDIVDFLNKQIGVRSAEVEWRKVISKAYKFELVRGLNIWTWGVSDVGFKYDWTFFMKCLKCLWANFYSKLNAGIFSPVNREIFSANRSWSVHLSNRSVHLIVCLHSISRWFVERIPSPPWLVQWTFYLLVTYEYSCLLESI